MTALQYVLAIVIILVSIGIIALVMLQEGKQQGLGAIAGAADNFFGKNKGKSIEAKMKKWTWLCLLVLAVFSIAFYVILELPIFFS